MSGGLGLRLGGAEVFARHLPGAAWFRRPTPGTRGVVSIPMRWKRLVMVVALGAAGTAGLRPAAAQPHVHQHASGAATDAKPPQLVNADDEWAVRLAEARDLAAKGSYDRAIEILQALILLPDSGFVAMPDGRLYVSLWSRISDVIGQMPPAGLKRYRRLYDPQAQRLYEQAAGAGDTVALRQIVYRYLHTSWGATALETLGSLHFDRGRFSQAARCWQQVLQLPLPPGGEAMLMAKIAAARHLAGEATSAEAAFGSLKTKHAGAEGVLGGRRRDLVEFVSHVRGLPVWAGGSRVVADWPGLGGVPSGMATMRGGEDVVLVPRWRCPQGAAASAGVGVGPAGAALRLGLHRTSSSMRYVSRMRGGHVYVERVSTRGSSRGTSAGYFLPAMIHPVVVGRMVIYRTDSSVVARDIDSGEQLWQAGNMPIQRAMKVRPGIQFIPLSISSSSIRISDSGHYALTVGGGMVYALEEFRPPGRVMNRGAVFGAMPGNSNVSADAADTSRLTAVSIRKEGYKEWFVGRGRGNDDVVRHGKFISAPTWHAGRLYVMVMYLESYYLVCLDPGGRGELIWKACIAQVPAGLRRYAGQYDHFLHRGSVPAVADGAVFVLTNSGVIAAFEAGTGQGLWAYQYDSSVNRSSMTSSSVSSVSRLPVNPLIVTRGRLICLPADSGMLLALAAESGKPLWSADRGNMLDLSAIDEKRVLLSGPGLAVVDTAGGKRLGGHESSITDIVGRPAVTPHAVLASGMGRIVRMDLDAPGYPVVSTRLSDANGLLGNLITAGEKLLAANTVGVCVYDDYEHVYEGLSERLAGQAGKERVKLLLQRGRLAFDARKFRRALDDFLVCAAQAADIGDTATGAMLQPWLHRTYVALGNRGKTAGEMLEMFGRAQAYADTGEEKVHMKIRLAKCRERLAGEKTDRAEQLDEARKAVALAHEVAADPAEDVVDCPIGAEAGDETTLSPRATRLKPGYWAHKRFLPALLEIHGRQAYARFDARAAEALAAARARRDPQAMLAVAEKFPLGRCANDALLAAGEEFYQLAAHQTGRGAKAQLQNAKRCLDDVQKRAEGATKLAGMIGLALIETRFGWTNAVARRCAQVRELCRREAGLSPEMQVAFGPVRGPVDDVLREIEGGIRTASPLTAGRYVGFVDAPMAEVFRVAGENVQVLRDQEHRPARIGEKVFVVVGDRATLIDTTAGDAKSAVCWAGATTADLKAPRSSGLTASPYDLLGAVTADGKTVVLVDRKKVVALDVASEGRARWMKSFSQAGIGQLKCSAAGEDVLVLVDKTGKLVCLEMATGGVLWTATITGSKRPQRAPVMAPSIAGGVVIVMHDGFRRLTCFSVASGKVLGSWQAKIGIDARVSPEGMLVTFIDGELAARATADVATKMWHRKYANAHRPIILALTADDIIVSPRQDSNVVEMIPVEGGGEPSGTFTTQNVGGQKAFPVDAVTDGESIYVTCATRLTETRRRSDGLGLVRGLSVQRLEPGIRTPRWCRVLEVAQGKGMRGQPLPLMLGRNHLVVAYRNYQGGVGSSAFVLETATGKPVRQIPLVGGANAMRNQAVWRRIGPPVLTDGRLCVETTEGLVIFGRK